MGPTAARARLIHIEDGASWRAFQEADILTGQRWEIIWCPSHLLDKDPPSDAKTKYEKARSQPGWRDESMQLGLHADELAASALKEGSGLHSVIAAREGALQRVQKITADVSIAVLLTTRLPQAAADINNPTLKYLWASRPPA